MMLMRCFLHCILCFYSDFLINLNHMLWVLISFKCLYREVDKKYTGCKLKNTELLDCGLIGVCAVIWSNTVVD